VSSQRILQEQPHYVSARPYVAPLTVYDEEDDDLIFPQPHERYEGLLGKLTRHPEYDLYSRERATPYGYIEAPLEFDEEQRRISPNALTLPLSSFVAALRI